MTEKKNTQNNNLIKDKLGVIMGLANERSLAWGIAESLYASQANIILTYQGEVLGKRVKPLSQKINSPAIFECDVSDETSIQHTFETIEKEYGKIDGGTILMASTGLVFQEFEISGNKLSEYKDKWWRRLDEFKTNHVQPRQESLLKA